MRGKLAPYLNQKVFVKGAVKKRAIDGKTLLVSVTIFTETHQRLSYSHIWVEGVSANALYVEMWGTVYRYRKKGGVVSYAIRFSKEDNP